MSRRSVLPSCSIVVAALLSLASAQAPLMLPSITISTTPEDHTPFKTLRIAVFDGISWTLSGGPMTAD